MRSALPLQCSGHAAKCNAQWAWSRAASDDVSSLRTAAAKASWAAIPIHVFLTISCMFACFRSYSWICQLFRVCSWFVKISLQFPMFSLHTYPYSLSYVPGCWYTCSYMFLRCPYTLKRWYSLMQYSLISFRCLVIIFRVAELRSAKLTEIFLYFSP